MWPSLQEPPLVEILYDVLQEAFLKFFFFFSIVISVDFIGFSY